MGESATNRQASLAAVDKLTNKIYSNYIEFQKLSQLLRRYAWQQLQLRGFSP
jgi:hypothetical protein